MEFRITFIFTCNFTFIATECVTFSFSRRQSRFGNRHLSLKKDEIDRHVLRTIACARHLLARREIHLFCSYYCCRVPHAHKSHRAPPHPPPPVPTCEDRWYGSNLFFFGFNSINVNSCVVYFICQNGKGGSGIT